MNEIVTLGIGGIVQPMDFGTSQHFLVVNAIDDKKKAVALSIRPAVSRGA